jgi:FkbM family methyltransferase
MASRLQRYIRAFGLIKGTEIYGKSKYGRQEYRLTVPGLRGPILLRGKTSDRLTFQKIFVDGEYLFDLDFTPRVILDGGANVGYSSLFFAQLFPQALIIAVEPEADNFRLLTQNTAAYSNIRPIQKALWPRRTNLVIENPSGEPYAFRVRESATTEVGAIPTATIEQLLHEAGVEWLDLLKLDVEGAEKELFEDPARDRWLGRTRALILEPHDWFKPGCTRAVEQAIANQPFRRTQLGENLLFIREKPLHAT